MEVAKIVEIKKELALKSNEELAQIVLHLSRFKKENKELLTYLLFLSENEQEYINEVKIFLNEMFDALSSQGTYRYVKGVRKILKETKKQIRFSKQKHTEIELILHFCRMLKANMKNRRSSVLENIYERQIAFIEKKIEGLHEDLQLDYKNELLDL